MEVIGMALIVGGMAYLFSGLIFLLPNPTAKRPAIVTENSDEDGCRTGVGLVRTLPASVSSIPRPAGTICASPAPDFFVEDAPTAVLVRQVLGAIAQFEKAALVAKLKAARDRKRVAAGKCEGRKSWAEINPELVREAMLICF